MMKQKLCILLICTLAWLYPTQKVTAGSQDKLEISSFGRIVAGTFDQKEAVFNGYDDSVSFDNDSLIALRADYQLNDEWAFVAQAIAHTDERVESGIQWLYADYRPNDALSFKLGRQRIPFYLYSDVLDVGFTYPWITPPSPLYSSYFFTEFDGVLGRLDFSNREVSGSLESYYGVFDGVLETVDSTNSVDVDYVYGFIALINVNSWRYRLAYHVGQVTIEPDEQLKPVIDALNAAGFSEAGVGLQVDGAPEYIAFGIDYESLDLFFRTEITNISAGDRIPFVPTQTSFYSTLGYNFYPFSAHVTLSASRNRYYTPDQQIPLGLAPELDQLSGFLDLIYDARPNDDLKSLTLGLRYDVTSNVALKIEHTWLEGKNEGRALFEQRDLSKPNQEGQLTQFAVEWVF
jgi:hypothetical protein